MSWQLVMRDFAIVTFAVDPERLAVLLPHSFEPDSFTLDDGTSAAFVSAVSFRVDSIIAAGVSLPLGYVQVNYRAYIRRHDVQCVWFFGSTVGSPIVILPRTLIGAPWHRGDSSLEAVWKDDWCSKYTLSNRGDWGEGEFSCTGTGDPTPRLDGFADLDETLSVLGSPRSGFSQRRDGSIFELRVEHPVLQTQLGSVNKARFSAFEDLNLYARGSEPHSVLLQRETTFELLPVRFIRKPGH